MDWHNVIELLVCIVASFAAGGVGSLFTVKAISTWYAGLKKPRYTPPNWVFGPVWTALYILMGISAFLVWQEGLNTDYATLAFILFWVQLSINAIWSVVFFGIRSEVGGVITIIVLWFLILSTIIASFPVSSWAGALLIPYISWVTIALYLNIGIWWLNKPAKR